jgi:hypothetical protein
MVCKGITYEGLKWLGKTKYKYVYRFLHNKKGEVFCGYINSKLYTWRSKYYDTEREVAVLVDLKLIEENKDPVNILKRK